MAPLHQVQRLGWQDPLDRPGQGDPLPPSLLPTPVPAGGLGLVRETVLSCHLSGVWPLFSKCLYCPLVELHRLFRDDGRCCCTGEDPTVIAVRLAGKVLSVYVRNAFILCLGHLFGYLSPLGGCRTLQ